MADKPAPKDPTFAEGPFIEIEGAKQPSLITTEGKAPEFLYRVVSQQEYDKAQETGSLSPSSFYERIHASSSPELQYSEPGNNVLLKIRYSPEDEWYSKYSGDKIYGVTRRTIPFSRVETLASGSPSDIRPKDQPRAPLLLEGPSEDRTGKEPSKGRMFRGIGSLMRGRNILSLLQGLREGYELLPEEYQVLDEAWQYLKGTEFNPFDIDKPGIESFKELLGISPEDLGETIPLPGRGVLEEDARQKRAREGGFEETLYFKHPEHGDKEVYEIENLLYHGTDDDIEEFDLNHPRRTDAGWLGTGVYLDTQLWVAKEYAKKKTSMGFKERGKSRGEGANVMPVKIRLKNPFFAPEGMKGRIAGIELEHGREAARKAADELTESLKKMGHDGVLLRRESSYLGWDGKPLDVDYEVVVFDTSDVKSVFSEFDPEYYHSPELSKAAGGFIDKPLYDDQRMIG